MKEKKRERGVRRIAHLPEIQSKGGGNDYRQVMNYVYQLEEQLRYALAHIDGDNITAGTVGAGQLAKASVQEENIAKSAVTGDKLAKNSVTKENLAESAVSKDKLSQDVMSAMDEKIQEAGNAQLQSAAFTSRVNSIIGQKEIDWRKIAEPGSDAIFSQGSGSGILFQRLSIQKGNLVNLPEGNLIAQGLDGKLYALGTGENTLVGLDGNQIGDGSITAEKMNNSVNAALAGSLDAEAFFSRQDVIQAVKAIMEEAGNVSGG